MSKTQFQMKSSSTSSSIGAVTNESDIVTFTHCEVSTTYLIFLLIISCIAFLLLYVDLNTGKMVHKY